MVHMRWCCGYLDDEALIAFLRKARMHLMNRVTNSGRVSNGGAYVVILENVDAEDYNPRVEDGQRVRKQSELERIFAAAGLHVYKRSEKRELGPRYQRVMLWALY